MSWRRHASKGGTSPRSPRGCSGRDSTLLAAVGDGATDFVKVAEKCKSQAVSMTKADLITLIADKLKFPWARAELLVDVVFGSMEQSMSRGKKIEIRATHPNYPYAQVPGVGQRHTVDVRHRGARLHLRLASQNPVTVTGT